MSAIQGLRDVSGFTVTGQRPENWREGVLLLFPNGDAPLTALTSLMKSEQTDDAKYHWFEKTMSDQRLTLSASITNVVTTIPVSAGAFEVRKGHLLYVEQTGEIMLVNSDQSADNSITTVIRGYSGTTNTAVTLGATVNPNIIIIGTAHEEGSSAPKGISYDPDEKFNYTQIFRDTLEATRTAIKTRLRTGDHMREAKREALQYHIIGMERAFWWGSRGQTTLNGKPLRTTEGFFSYMAREASTRVQAVPSAQLSLAQLELYLKDIFDYGSSEKMAFCGNRALLTIQQVIRKNSTSPYVINQGQKEFGMNVSRLTSPFGEIVLKSHPLFNRVVSGSDYAAVDSWIAVMDMENVKYRYLKDSDTKYATDLQVPGDDQQKAGYLTECGLELHFAKSHYLIKNASSARTDP